MRLDSDKLKQIGSMPDPFIDGYLWKLFKIKMFDFAEGNFKNFK